MWINYSFDDYLKHKFLDEIILAEDRTDGKSTRIKRKEGWVTNREDEIFQLGHYETMGSRFFGIYKWGEGGVLPYSFHD